MIGIGDNVVVEWWGIIPFLVMLSSIAALPLIGATAERWEDNKVKLAVALCLGVPVAIWFIAGGDTRTVVHALFEYAQFITLLFALFVVSGGIFLAGDIQATPKNNTIFLAIGGAAASFIGTTGAAMLLIRPLLNTNRERKYKVHTVVFTIFIVANCGGLLTPLGDPPLFLGMLRGVPFLWTFSLFKEWLFVNGLLLLTYYAIDRRFYAQEKPLYAAWDKTNVEPLRIRGSINFIFFAMIISAVALAPSMDLAAIETGTASGLDYVPLREIIMLSAAALSYFIGERATRFEDNQFTWGPILEVAALFIGIFLTMMPALKYLGQIAPSLPLNEITFHLFTGSLSSVLDNAPTYVTFFEMALNTSLAQDPSAVLVAGVPEIYLTAISLGAVFWGAVTYIGNGPNFMVKSVADSRGVPMPDFVRYVVEAFRYLVPILLANMLIFIAQPMWAKGVGLALTLVLIGRAIIIMRVSPKQLSESAF